MNWCSNSFYFFNVRQCSEISGLKHVGSGCRYSSRYDFALDDAKALFELAEREYGFKMTVLDIGGGFPG